MENNLLNEILISYIETDGDAQEIIRNLKEENLKLMADLDESWRERDALTQQENPGMGGGDYGHQNLDSIKEKIIQECNEKYNELSQELQK